MRLVEILKNKLVVSENIAQIAEDADSCNADAGLISLASASQRALSLGNYVLMPEHSYPPLLQGAVVIKQGPAVEEARQFLAFLLSPPVRRQLAERGWKAP